MANGNIYERAITHFTLANEEVNCTEPSRSVSIPRPIDCSQTAATQIAIAYTSVAAISDDVSQLSPTEEERATIFIERLVET
jgi:hypothetical protein